MPEEQFANEAAPVSQPQPYRTFDEQEIREIFSYHPPTEAQRETYEKINAAFIECAKTIAPLLPNGPGKTVAIRDLMEAKMLCASAIGLPGGLLMSMPSTKRYTKMKQAEEKTIVSAYQRGLTSHQVAKMFNRSTSAVCRALQRSKIPTISKRDRIIIQDPDRVNPHTRLCAKCQKRKDIKEFYKSSATIGGVYKWCKTCATAYNKGRHHTPPAIYVRYKADARYKGREFTLTFDDFLSFWQKPCFYCGEPIKTIGLDRVDSSKGYTLDNLVSACFTCNGMKSDLDQKEFLLKCQQITEHLQSNAAVALEGRF